MNLFLLSGKEKMLRFRNSQSFHVSIFFSLKKITESARTRVPKSDRKTPKRSSFVSPITESVRISVPNCRSKRPTTQSPSRSSFVCLFLFRLQTMPKRFWNGAIGDGGGGGIGGIGGRAECGTGRKLSRRRHRRRVPWRRRCCCCCCC